MLKPGSFVFIVLLGLVFATGTLGTDLFSPAQPFIATDLNASEFKTQLIMSAYLLGLAIAQLVFGLLSDRFGRKPVLRAGLWLFTLSTFACVFAPTIEVLIVLRFVQGFAASSGLVVSRAIARDLFEGRQLGRVMSFMSLTLSLSPVLLPPIGGLLSSSFGWQANFVFLTAIALLVLLATEFGINESSRNLNTRALIPGEVISSLRRIGSSRAFIGYMITGTVCFSGLFAFISNSSFFFRDYFGTAMDAFGLYLGLAFIGHSAGIFLGGMLVTRVGSNRLIMLGASICCFSGIMLLLIDQSNISTASSVFIFMTVYLFGAGFVYPHSLAGALHEFPRSAGVASATMGFCVMATSGLTSAIVGYFYTGTPAAMTIFVAAVGTLTLVLYRIFQKAGFFDVVPSS